MGRQSATWLLILFFFLPVGLGDVRIRLLIVQTLLNQIKAIKIAQQAEKLLAASIGSDEALTLLDFWLKWHRDLQSRLPINTEQIDLWFISLLYHLEMRHERAEAFWELLRASWFDPQNATTSAYLGVLTPCPVFLSHQDGDLVTGHSFTLIGQANPQVMIHCQVFASLTILGGLFPVASRENLLETDVQTDDSGQFKIHVSLSSLKLPKTRYIISARANPALNMTSATEIILIQA